MKRRCFLALIAHVQESRSEGGFGAAGLGSVVGRGEVEGETAGRAGELAGCGRDPESQAEGPGCFVRLGALVLDG